MIFNQPLVHALCLRTTGAKATATLAIAMMLLAPHAFATRYSSSSASHTTTQGVQPGNTNQEILMVTVNGENGGGGAWQIDQITFTTSNTSNADVDNAYCYYSTDAVLDIPGDVLKGTIANPAGNLTFTINEGGLGGNGSSYYIFLVYDISSSAVSCSGNVVDALVQTAGLVTSGNSAGSHTPTTNNPTGSRAIEGPGCWTMCAVNGTSNAFGYLRNVSFNTINRTSVYDGYVNTGNSTTIEQGTNLTMSVTMSNSSTTGRYTAAWIDFNNDGDFDDAGENVMAAEINTGTGMQSRSVMVNVPLTATIGTTKMRVVWKYAPSQTAPEPCDTYTDQIDWEDYDINIIAATNMAFNSFTCTQTDLTNITAGLTKRMILGLEVVTTGAANPISISSFTFSTSGSTNAANDIVQAQVYSTGTSSSFQTGDPIGTAYVGPNGVFIIAPATAAPLVNGTNYLWLTYDIETTASCANVVDATCTSMIVAGATETPVTSAPFGSRTIDCITPYYSQGNLDANLLSSWNSERNGSGSAPGSFGTGDGFFVQGGHSMTTSADVTIPYLSLEGGSYVTASNLVSCDILVIQTGATFEQRFAATTGTYITEFFIYDDATWIHNNAGWLPAVNRYFDPNSNQWFYQWGGGTFPSGTIWGNVLLNGITTGNFAMGNVLTDIQGDFEWRRTGDLNVNYLYDQSDETLNIGGDLIFSSTGWFHGAGDNGFPFAGTANVTMNVGGDFVITGGRIDDYFSGATGSGLTINVGGNVTISGGTANLDSSPAGDSELNLTGGNATVNWNQTAGAITLCNTNIASGKTVTLTGTTMGSINTDRTITIQDGGALYTRTVPAEGPGGFTVASNGTLGMGATNAEGAITSTAAAGNVQVTGTRTFNAGGHYEYTGTGNQFTGDQLPTPITGSLTMNNTAQTVTLTQNTTVSGDLNLTQGDLVSTSTERLTIDAPATITPVRGSANSFVSGWVDRVINAANDFEVPIGSSPDNRWRPITITGQDATSRTWTVEFVDTDPETLGNTYEPNDSCFKMNTFYYYNVTRAPATGTVDVTIWYDDTDLGTLRESSVVIGHWNGALWNAWDMDNMPVDWVRDAAGNTIKGNSISTFSPIGVGGDDTPLPVELLDFVAQQHASAVLLHWSTGSEINNDYFTVERSPDGRNFHAIGRIEGAGNSTQLVDYSLPDENPLPGISYYRLRQTDFDGTVSFSQLEAVKFDKSTTNTLTAFPNPAADRVGITFDATTEGNAMLELHDATGKLVWTARTSTYAGTNSMALDLTPFSKGMYFLSVATETTIQRTKILIKR